MSRRWISPHRPSRGDDDDEEFPRRFPRTGGSFQARTIPDIATEYKSERRTPQVMSQGLPFLTEAEAGRWWCWVFFTVVVRQRRLSDVCQVCSETSWEGSEDVASYTKAPIDSYEVE